MPCLSGGKSELTDYGAGIDRACITISRCFICSSLSHTYDVYHQNQRCHRPSRSNVSFVSLALLDMRISSDMLRFTIDPRTRPRFLVSIATLPSLVLIYVIAI